MSKLAHVFVFAAISFFATGGSAWAALAELRIASWNMENGPNNASDDADLSTILTAMGNESVLGVTRAVDILSMSETDTDSAPDTASVFNSIYGGGLYASVVSTPDGGSDRTGFVYNTSTVSLLGTSELSVGLTHNILRAEFAPVASPGDSFYMYSVHLKSGATTSDENARSTEADIIRADADALGALEAVIFGGDYNWNDADESSDPNDSAWDVFTSAGNAQGFDAYDITNVSGAGDWRDNPAFLELHSQDPGGALDDRFDAQFVTDEFFDSVGLELIQGSYRVFGNDGSHTLNSSITTGSGASPTVLAALASFSDHLPVVSDYQIVAAVIPEPTMLLVFVGLGCSTVMRTNRSRG